MVSLGSDLLQVYTTVNNNTLYQGSCSVFMFILDQGLLRVHVYSRSSVIMFILDQGLLRVHVYSRPRFSPF